MSIKRSLSLAQRLEFYSMPEPNSGCVLWLGSTFANTGYGRMSWRGKARLVHRLSWEAHRGPIPNGLCVCHKCDVQECLNPEHLFIGTHAENMADRDAKGRGYKAIGELSTSAKITADDVRKIRTDRRPAKIMASELGIARDTVYHIRSGITWKHVQ